MLHINYSHIKNSSHSLVMTNIVFFKGPIVILRFLCVLRLFSYLLVREGTSSQGVDGEKRDIMKRIVCNESHSQ